MQETFLISVVDDDESVREALVDLMRSHGYLAEAYESAASFLDSGRAEATDCLIADMHMPGMTGLELHGRLMAEGASIPTILITARHNEGLRARSLHQGVCCYLPKPFAEDELMRCLHSALGDRGEDGA